MSTNPDIQQLVSNRLMLEALDILKQAAADKPGANGGYYAWFQHIITDAEASNNQARGIAAVIVMQAYGQVLSSSSVDLGAVVLENIQRTVSGS